MNRIELGASIIYDDSTTSEPTMRTRRLLRYTGAKRLDRYGRLKDTARSQRILRRSYRPERYGRLGKKRFSIKGTIYPAPKRIGSEFIDLFDNFPGHHLISDF